MKISDYRKTGGVNVTSGAELIDNGFLGTIWKTVCKFAPITMLLKLYSFCVMCFDINYLIFYTIYTIFQSIYKLFKPPPLRTLNGEIALVVGAGRGIGRDIALQLGELDVIVICLDINSIDNDETSRLINERSGGTSKSYTCNVTDQNQVKKTIIEIIQDYGNITMLYHCCGVPSPRSIIQDQPPAISQTIDVSILSYFWLLEEVMPIFKKHFHGHIIILTSVAGLSGIQNQMPLSISQFAVNGIFESLVEDLRLEKYNNFINVTLVHIYPFIISNDLMQDIRLRIPSYFGIINSIDAAAKILDGVRRNYMEISIPGYLLYFGHLLRLLPRRATFMLRDLLDTGINFG